MITIIIINIYYNVNPDYPAYMYPLYSNNPSKHIILYKKPIVYKINLPNYVYILGKYDFEQIFVQNYY